MSTWTVLVVAIFLNATDPPKTFSAVLLPDVKCSNEVAADFARYIMPDVPILGFAYSCDVAHGPDAPKHVPGKDEA